MPENKVATKAVINAVVCVNDPLWAKLHNKAGPKSEILAQRTYQFNIL